jgi:excinuclease ABC subunit C
MNRAARAGNYEDAAKLRNQYFGLEELKKKIVFSDKEFLDISSDQALKGLQRLLKLKTPPRRIEGYDISHISGENTVASMVVFTNGASDRPEYRKFKIRSSTNDDLKSMQEVITRRLKHQEWPFPDLIILDGGATQVSVIKPLLDPHHIPVIGRDKSGDHSKSAEVKIYLPDNDTITRLPDNSHIAKLIARVDEESHRFAITYHRLLQKKTLYK